MTTKALTFCLKSTAPFIQNRFDTKKGRLRWPDSKATKRAKARYFREWKKRNAAFVIPREED